MNIGELRQDLVRCIYFYELFIVDVLLHTPSWIDFITLSSSPTKKENPRFCENSKFTQPLSLSSHGIEEYILNIHSLKTWFTLDFMKMATHIPHPPP